MLITLFLAVVFCVAITLMLLSAVAFVQDKRFFSSAPPEVRERILPREHELFFGARAIGWTLMVFAVLLALGVFAVAVADGIKSGFTFWQFFVRFLLILNLYKIYDMVFFDYFLLMKFKFFQHYYPETASALEGRRYGFNLKSQLLKLLIVFPAVSALAAWICVRLFA